MSFLFALLAVLFCSQIQAHTAVVAHSVARPRMQPCFLELKINGPKQATLQGYKVDFTLKYNSLLTKFMQCERSECELPETGLMRFGAMRIIAH